MSCAINAWGPHGAPPAPLQDHPLYILARGAWRAMGAPPPTGWSDGPGHLCLLDPETGALVELTTAGAEVAFRWLAVDPTGRVPPLHSHGGRAEANAALWAYAEQADASPASLLTAARFFSLVEDAAPDLSLELIDGRIVAMAGASPNHEAIMVSTSAALLRLLRPGGCKVLGSNVYVAAGDDYTLPDVTVVCGAPDWVSIKGSPTRLQNPTILVEIVSPSSQLRDTITKVESYRSIRSLEAYIVIHTEHRLVEVWRRDATDAERYTTGALRLHQPGLMLALDDLYEQTDIPDSADM
ncbi:MAG: hypothetical protein RL071_3209 [Pseudomonadota bacterium]